MIMDLFHTSLTSFIISLSAGVTLEAAKKAVNYVRGVRPELVEGFETAQNEGNTGEIERIFNEAIDVIDVAAGSGKLSSNGGDFSALRGIRFDHQAGKVQIAGSSVNAPIVVTGGSSTASGQTTITNSEMTSRGTRVEVSGNASITLTGNATIKQT